MHRVEKKNNGATRKLATPQSVNAVVKSIGP